MNTTKLPTGQTKDILAHLISTGSINPAEALNEFGCMRLSARIWELRNVYGIPIKTRIEVVPTRNGNTANVAVYELVLEEAQA